MLNLLCEEEIAESHEREYFQELYRVVCIGERSNPLAERRQIVRSTYVVDWEQLVHLLEEYEVFGEDIVEVSAMSHDDPYLLPYALGMHTRFAHA